MTSITKAPSSGPRRAATTGLWVAVLVACTALLLATIGAERALGPVVGVGGIELVAFYASTASIYALTYTLWRRFSELAGTARTPAEALVDLGVGSVGKYAPGKVLGLLGRGAYTPDGIRIGRRQAALSLSEQLVCLWGGLALLGVGSIATLTGLASLGSTGIALIVVSSCLLAVAPFRLLAHVRCAPRAEPFRHAAALGMRGGMPIVWGYVVLWAMNAVPFLVLANAAQPLDASSMTELAVAFVGAVIAGWLAFFVPAGIGVREAVFVWLAPGSLDWEQATALMLLHRGLTAAFDVAVGAAALGVVSARRRTATAR